MIKLPRWPMLILSALALCGIALVLWYASSPRIKAQKNALPKVERGVGQEPITPLPLLLKLDAAKVALGGRLFHEPRLSGDDTVSCAQCHDLNHGGVDHAVHSHGVGGKEGVINAPTIFNSGFNFRQLWDGRAETLEEQIDGPLLNPAEMASNWPQVIAKLNMDADYRKAFSATYPDGITPTNIKDAIGTFERSLYTPNSRFDRFLRGDKSALNSTEQAGYMMFKEIGCVACHQGMNVGGNLFEKIGIMGDYFAARGHLTRADLGRYNHTGIEAHRFEFKVPSLRNVALTAPYFHDGSAATLEEAVRVMAKYQLGMDLNEAEQRLISDFLRTLTGEYQGVPLK